MDTFVGYNKVELFDDHKGVTFPMAVMYPTCAPGKPEKIGPYSMNVSINSAIKEGLFPLILLSHGNGAGHLEYRTLAYHLALNGFVVGVPDHPFNNWKDNSLEGTVENLINRPRHLHIAINWFFDSDDFGRSLKPNSVFVIGHSMGGYTALAVAGGVPTSLANESLNRQPQQISVTHDHRVKAIVLLTPAAEWFRAKGALSEVKVPILMLTGEKDELTPHFHAQIVLDGVPDNAQIKHRIVENAGHFSFLSPFPEHVTKPDFPPSQDPPGFDRESFLQELNAEVLDFLLKLT